MSRVIGAIFAFDLPHEGAGADPLEEEMTEHKLKVFGWGREEEAMTPTEEAFALGTYQILFGISTFESSRCRRSRR